MAALRVLAAAISAALALQPAASSYDVVLRNARVLDPASSLDAIRNVGITGKKIAAVSADPLRGRVEIDATGLVAAPGFIDLHSHGQTPENYRYKAMDGVTAALELEVGVAEAKSLKVKMMVEGANGPTYPEAEEIMLGKGIDVIPDILCNSGSVIVSYYEWLQNKRAEQWELADVLGRLERRMKQTYANVRQYATAQKTDWRTASYAIGLERLQHCYKERGIFP